MLHLSCHYSLDVLLCMLSIAIMPQVAMYYMYAIRECSCTLYVGIAWKANRCLCLPIYVTVTFKEKA